MNRSKLPSLATFACLLATALPAQDPSFPAAGQAATGTARPAEPPPEPLPATVKGRVLDPAGKPMAAVAIGFGSDKTLLTAAVLQQPKATTDAEGRFQFVLEPPDEKWRDAWLHFARKGSAGALHGAMPKYDREKKEFATEKDFGDLTMIPGARLFGRVRDPDGKPLPGARIVMRDLFETGRWARGRGNAAFCASAADDKGIFDLPCALAYAVRIEVALEGYYSRTLSPVSSSTPLEITLQPSGFVAGRVLDPDGRGIEGAYVSAAYELRGPSESARTGPGGTFRFTVAQPCRYRVTASQPQGDNAGITGRSAVLTEPQGNLEIYLKQPEGRSEGGEFTVQAVVKKTGEKVAEFTAAAVFEQYANQNASYLEYRLRSALRSAQKAKDGATTLNGPGKNGTNTGAVRVLAAGFAPATLKDFEWKELQAGEARPPAVLELVAESTLSGKVVDETTGEPVAGAKVWARPQTDRNQGNYEGDQVPPEAVTTAADGSYAVPMLGEGPTEVMVRHEQRPKVPSVTVELAAEQQKTGFDLKLPAGAVVQLTLTGAEIGQGWKAFLQELPDFNPSNSGGVRYYGNGNEPPNAVEIKEGGKVRWQGLKLADYRLILSVPSPPRCGGQVFVPVEPFRVRRGGIEREVDIAQDRPGHVRGTVTFPGAGVPLDRVIVTARQVADDQNAWFNPYQNDWSGPRTFVDRSGAFDLLLGPGRYTLELVDIQTGVRLHGTATPLTLGPGGSVECNLAPMLLSLRIKLEPEQEGKVAVADRLEVRCLAKELKQNGRMFGNNDNYDMGNGFDLEPGQREVQLVVPPSDVSLFLRSSVANIRVDDQRGNQPPLQKLDFEALEDQNAPREFTVKVPPPPEIPAEDEKKVEGAVGADGTKK